MWAAAVSFLLGVVKWLFGQRQQTEGVAQGNAQRGEEDVENELKEAAIAHRGAIAAGDAGLDSVLNDPNNAGAAASGKR